MAKVCSVWDLAGALLAAESPVLLGPDRTWNWVNPEQARFLDYFDSIRAQALALQAEGLLDTKASLTAATINDWFKDQNFEIELTEMNDPNVFYLGAIYRQLLKWMVPGREDTLLDGQVPAVYMESSQIGYFKSSLTKEIIVMLPTEGGDVAYMTMLSNVPEGPFDLLRLAQLFEIGLRPVSFTGLKFPMVNLKQDTDLSWMKGLWTTQAGSNRKASIIEAKQQSILKINEKGALAKSAAGMAGVLESMMVGNVLEIDRPFLFWISRSGYNLPLFVAWVDYNDWGSQKI